jgi:hypothetical protein
MSLENADGIPSPCVMVGVTSHQKDVVVTVAAKLAALFGVTLVCAHADNSRYPTEEHADGSVSSTPIDPDVVEEERGFRSHACGADPRARSFRCRSQLPGTGRGDIAGARAGRPNCSTPR